MGEGRKVRQPDYVHYFYIQNKKQDGCLKEYGFVISEVQNEYLQHLKQKQGSSEAEIIRKITDLVFDNKVVKQIENLNIEDNVGDKRKNVKFSKKQLAQLEQIANDLNKYKSSLKFSKAEVIRRLITSAFINKNNI
ncbi:MAG: hypothetical protein JM58_04180 [Peptococcaceae bacterium BICA1-8]|nr:MAG: hypothetical protein JM58_04180 [Peptococcaceae bacterium BICA1-8]